jgi:hypothetical protein
MHAEIITALIWMPGSNMEGMHWYALWPRITSTTLIEQLSTSQWKKLDQCSREWKECFVEYAKAWTVLQRAKRLMGLFNKDDMNGLKRSTTSATKIGNPLNSRKLCSSRSKTKFLFG